MKITLLATNAYKVVYEDVNTDETVDQLKLRLFREHSDHLPLPSSIFEDLEVLKPKSSSGDADVTMTDDSNDNKEDDGDMLIDNTNLPPQLLHPYQLRLIFGGRQLESLSTMAENSIVDGCTILVAVSPFYLLGRQIANETKPKTENYSTTDRLFTAVNKNNQVQFQLALDDQVGDGAGIEFSKLTELDIVEASQLLMRVPSLESQDTSSNNNNAGEPFKLYQSKTGSPKPASGKTGLFSRLSTRSRSKEQAKHETGSSLESQFDQLSLAPLGKRDEYKRVPLSIVSQTPTGSNLLVHRIQVIFNRPFIPLCSTLDEVQVPFRVEPAVIGGKWRWIDGVTCCFEDPKQPYQTKFASSTQYRVTPLLEVFKKYEPEIGDDEIGESWTFKTSIQYPIFGQFNGDIADPQINLRFAQSLPLTQFNRLGNAIKIKGPFNKTINFKVVPIDSPTLCKLFKDSLPTPIKKSAEEKEKEEEKEKDESESNTKSIYLQLDKLDMNTKYSIQFTEPLESSEGPLVTENNLEVTFKTPEPLRVTKVNSSFEGESVVIAFNNQVDKILIEDIDKHLQFKPNVKVSKVRTEGYNLIIHADFKPNTSYKVKVDNITSPRTTSLVSSSHDFKTPLDYCFIDVDSAYSQKFNLDPLARPIVKLVTRGVSYVKIESHRIDPSNAKNYDHERLAKLLTKEIQINGVEPRKQVTNKVDLSDFFGGDTPFTAKHNLLVFRFSSKADGGNLVESYKLLQYSPFLVAVNQTKLDYRAWVTNASTQQRVKTPFIETYYNKSKVYSQRSSDSEAEALSAAPNSSVVLSDGLFSIPKDQSFDLLIATVTVDKRKYSTIFQTVCQKEREKVEVIWDIVDALGCYRPTETVYIKGNLRITTENGIQTPLEYYGDNQMSIVNYKLTDTRKKVQNQGHTTLNVNGGFNFNFVLPADTNLGDCSLSIDCDGHSKNFVIKVLECKRKDFVVESDLKKPSAGSSSSVRCGQPFYVQACGRYFNDEVMANTKVDWSVSLSPTQPDLPTTGYRFSMPDVCDEANATYTYQSKPNPSGRHQLRLVLENSKSPMYLVVRGSVIDLTNKSEAFSHTCKVLGTQRYFGVSKCRDEFINLSDTFQTSLVAMNSSGKLINEGKFQVEIKMVPWEDDLPMVNEFQGEIVPSKAEPTNFTYKFNKRGAYCVKFTYECPDQEPQRQSHNIFVLGEQTQAEKEFKENDSKTLGQYNDSFEQQQSTFGIPSIPFSAFDNKYPINLALLVKSGSEYPKIGDKIELLVTCKLQCGMGMIMQSKSKSIVKSTQFNFEDGKYLFEHVVTEKDFPSFNYTVYVEGKVSVYHNNTIVERYTSASINKQFSVDKEMKKLQIEFLPYRKFQSPNSDISITTRVLDHQKKPVTGAEITLIVADESLLSLTNKSTNNWNPIDLFYYEGYQNNQCFSLIDDTMFCAPDVKEEEVTKPKDTIVNITVRYLSGRIIQMSLPLNANIDEVRKVVLERDGLPFTSQRLLHKNKQIEKGTLFENGITTDDTINLVIRLSGGGDTGNEKEDLEALRLPAIKQIKVRDNFKPLATFQSNRFSDENGQVVFDFKLPDNLTKYRVMAYAATNDSFGKNQEFFTSTLPVMIRQNPPRFLNYNDECTFPIVISNIVDYDVEVSCAFQTTNCISSTNGFKSVIPANSRIIAPFQVKAITPNVKSFYHVVLASRIINTPGVDAEFTDAVKFDFPVYSPSSVESNTVAGFTDAEKIVSTHPVKLSNWQEFDQEVGGLSVNLATSNITQISSSYEYLMNYKHSCSEQLASKLMCLVIALDLPELLEMENDRPSEENLEKAITEILEILKGRLKATGEFKYWNSDTSYEYVNVYVYWVLDIIENEFNVVLPKGLMAKAPAYLRGAADIDKTHKEYTKYDRSSYLLKKAFALHTYEKVSYGSFESHNAIDSILVKEATSSTSPIAADLSAILLPLAHGVTARQLVRSLENKLVVTGTTAFFEGSSINGFSSIMRSSCWAALSMIDDDQCKHIISKLMFGIESKIRDPRQSMYFNTQDSALTMYTLFSYYNNKAVNKYNVQVYLNDFTLEPKPVEITDENTIYTKFIPMKTLIKNQGELLIEKKGTGDLFYSLSFKYAKSNPYYPAVDTRGFVITREFIPLGKPEDIQQIVNEAGLRQTVIKSGAKIKVKLTIKSTYITNFVVINDNLPAGLEPINNLYSTRYYWTSHSNIRDKGAEIFADLLYPGTYTFYYNVQALCHGSYICPPARIEEMYCPSTFGRTSTDTVIII
ncbi:ubiquitin domain-containing protein [Heterostelium album PN500]|uniref:Ubiquitin domain-containing protein n=1 Tax=Heterostelium pallidum (strain ATCC 26659 / Pp 5 / PN500) TaxID=670386 RepID=D3B0G9_HETP5|nr:ubiquitin domain-containing protein [Heterostelium album PN500]EFA84793.1 ubiquitin domain-containing protein [Heterostelium album PN500]|eukprot:XP_020436904.1 ubiquitin domain-containing protein [Heterostelium album PN500]